MKRKKTRVTPQITKSRIVINRIGPGPVQETPMEKWMRDNLGDENITVEVNGVSDKDLRRGKN
jgi:hypothetical protein